LLSGCVTVSQKSPPLSFSSVDYIDIESFCKKHNLKYNFDTIDDIVTLFSPDREIKILLGSHIGSCDGMIFRLEEPPVYFKGKILIPSQLGTAIFSRKLTTFRPLFAINTIVIDPGHGGKDPGAISPKKLKEKTVNLSISKYLKAELEKQGFRVFLTRSNDKYLSLKERVVFAKNHNADLFISIHANSNHSRKVQGVEVYYLSPSRLNSQERSLKLAKSEGFEAKELPFNAKAILWDMLISKNYSFSVELSNILYFNFKNLGFKVKSPKRAPFYVLRYAYVPSVLVEVGYLSNYYEEKILRKKYYQKQIAETIAFAVNSLKKRYGTSYSGKYADSDNN